ncbi:MAG: hypothetical protein V7K21_06030 [Nostoc sp.]|uniref:hypothetical protein n=1 Tax=Nostoc sp. TaxID=1180 RepID=UPI002FFB87D7
MNELDVIVKLYEKCLHKASLDPLHLVYKAILLIPASVNKSFNISIWLQCQATFNKLRVAKTKTRLKTGIYFAFPKDWQDGSQNTDDGKSNSLRSPSL